MAEECNLFIGNLPFDTTESDLDGLLAPFGKVSKLNLVMDRDSGRPKGFAFATFEDARDGEDAIKDLDGTELHGRNIVVNRSTGGRREGGSRDSGRGGRDGGYGGRDSNRGGSGCFNCGKEGHMSRECPEGGRGGGGGGRGGGSSGGRSCYNCGKDGHMSRECPDGGRGGGGGGRGGNSSGGRGCFNCGKDGHMSRECPEGGRGGGGGGRGGGGRY